MRCPAPGRTPARRSTQPWRARSGGSPTAPSCCSTAWSRAPPRRCSWDRRAGCGRSCSCTCRWATGASATSSSSAAAPSSRRAHGREIACAELYALPLDRVHVAEPGVDAAAIGAGDRGRRRAALRRGGDARQGPRRDARRARDGDGPVLAPRVRRQPGPRPGVRRRRAAPRARQRPPRPRALPGTAHGGGARPRVRRRGPARARRRTPRPTAWSSPRPWRAACPCSPPRSAGWPRRWGTATTARGRGCSSRPATRRPSAPRCATGSGTPSCAARLRRAARERRASLRGWSATTSVLAGVLDGGGAMTATVVRVSPEWLALREPADAAARSVELVERLARHLPAAGPLVDPRPRRRRRRDGPLARAAPARAAALGGARPRRGPPGARGRHPAGRGATVETRQSDVTRLAPRRSRRREPHRRLGAARHPGGRRAEPDARRVHRRRVPDAARADGRRPRRASGRRIRWTPRSRAAFNAAPAPPARPGRRRGRRRRAQGRRAPRCSSRRARGAWMRPTPT